MAPGRAVLTRVPCWQMAPDAALSSRLRAGPASDLGCPDCGEPPLLSLARAPLLASLAAEAVQTGSQRLCDVWRAKNTDAESLSTVRRLGDPHSWSVQQQ